MSEYMIRVTTKPLTIALKSKEERAKQLQQVREKRKINIQNFLRHRANLKTS
jgi:hypothetical protein